MRRTFAGHKQAVHNLAVGDASYPSSNRQLAVRRHFGRLEDWIVAVPDRNIWCDIISNLISWMRFK